MLRIAVPMLLLVLMGSRVAAASASVFAGRDAGVRGKVVVIGYDGPSAPQLAVAGKMELPHHLFIAMFQRNL